MNMFNKITKSNKPYYTSPTILRKLFLIFDNEIHLSTEKLVIDRRSIIPKTFTKFKVKIYSGKSYHKREVNRWMIGFKFGEFSWTRKMALYKAKQLRKKNKKLNKSKK